MEICSGCGAAAEQHPIFGVTRDRETGRMAEFPVCAECWINPEHRTAPLKMHFFEHAVVDAQRRSAAQIVKDAEDNILSDPPPSEPAEA
jgi:hypothetical protein